MMEQEKRKVSVHWAFLLLLYTLFLFIFLFVDNAIWMEHEVTSKTKHRHLHTME